MLPDTYAMLIRAEATAVKAAAIRIHQYNTQLGCPGIHENAEALDLFAQHTLEEVEDIIDQFDAGVEYVGDEYIMHNTTNAQE